MHDGLPFRYRLTLQPLIAFWRSLTSEGDDSSASFVESLLDEVRASEVVSADSVSPEQLEAEASLVAKLMSAVFPWATNDRNIAAAILPFQAVPFYSTPAFRELSLLDFLDPERNPGCSMSAEEMSVARSMKAYHLIVERLYGRTTDFNLPFVVGGTDPETGLERFFQIEFDPRFLRVHVRGQKPRVEEEELTALLDDPQNLSRWQAALPAERFEFSGFGILRATEVTNQQLLSLIKNDLLNHRDFTANDGLTVLRGHLRSFLGIPDLDVGIIALESQSVEELADSRVIGRSLLLSEDKIPDCPRTNVSTYARAVETREPVIMQRLDPDGDMTGLEWHVHTLGYRSLAVVPLVESGRIVGLMELVSETPDALLPRNTFRLSEITPLLATALNRTLEEREHRIQSLIKKRYTAVHPVVEWRFREAALAQLESGWGRPAGPIVFEDVYPLYGLSDVRNSSTFRADAVRDDLSEQLGMALAVVIEASSIVAQPALDELGFRIGQQIEELQGVLAAGEESEPLRLLQEEVEPLFPKLARIGPSVARRIEEYRKAIDTQLGMVYRQRRDFEISLTRVNDVLSQYLESREEVAQQLVPHYFEKYRTDGVDYNIYVGASLHRNRPFDELDLRNLRLWQLMTMAGCVWEMDTLRPDLAVELDVTHLILVQSQPLAIRFRPDEKKFDVDGAYNIRYEIVKKRIDKAEVRGTGERLTQPGKIAIGYSLASEQREYLRYIEYLQNAGYLEEGVEMLDLEPLQGVHGLRAMRVTVAEKPPETDFLVELLPEAGIRKA